MTGFMVISVIIAIVSIVIFGTDFFVNKILNLKRVHIGRWESREKWRQAVEKRAVWWLKYTPTVRQTDNSRYVLIDILKGKYRNQTIQSWQKAGLLVGLKECTSDWAKKEVEKWKKQIFDENGMWKKNIDKVDFSMLGYAALLVEEDTNKIRPAMENIINMLEKNLCPDGLISYSQGKESVIRFVDTLGMVCPFLALYGRIYQEKKYLNLAVEQIRKFRKIGLYTGSQLPCHAVNIENQKPLGIYGWGRGTVWYIIALVDTFRELPEGCVKREVKQWICEAAEEYLTYQKEDGSFYTILQGAGQYDSSVTAGMAYFYRSCAEIFENQEYKKIAERCITRIMKVTMKNGAIDQCQGDTHGIGIFSQVFDIMPFVQGLILRAMEE